MQNKLALFDVDGTLVDLFQTHIDVYTAFFQEVYGIPGVNFRGKYRPGGTNEETVRDVLTYLGYSEDFINKGIKKVVPTFERLYSIFIKKAEIKILPGVENLLAAVQEKEIPKGIVTGNVDSVADLILEKSGLNKYFPFKATSNDSKERRGRLIAVIEKSERITNRKYSRNHIYFFDDSDGSIPISRELGIKSVAVATNERDVPFEKLQASNPDYLFRDLSDTETVLKILD